MDEVDGLMALEDPALPCSALDGLHAREQFARSSWRMWRSCRTEQHFHAYWYSEQTRVSSSQSSKSAQLELKWYGMYHEAPGLLSQLPPGYMASLMSTATPTSPPSPSPTPATISPLVAPTVMPAVPVPIPIAVPVTTVPEGAVVFFVKVVPPALYAFVVLLLLHLDGRLLQVLFPFRVRALFALRAIRTEARQEIRAQLLAHMLLRAPRAQGAEALVVMWTRRQLALGVDV